jgi:drug/metabolite transporter (DMT)-like permease
MGLATLALFWLAASEAAIIAYTMPIWASLLAWPVLGERPTWPRVAGLALGLTGVSILMAGQLLSAPMADLIAKLPGVACILGTALMFAGGAVFSKRYPTTMPPVPLLAWQLAVGMTPMLLLSLAFEPWTLVRVTTLGWAALAYVAVVAMCVSYLAWFRALKLLPASTAAIGTLLVPIIGVLSSAAVLGEPLGPRQVLALVMTVGGVLLASRG